MLYATDGSWNVTVSDGSTEGAYAPDGSRYVVQRTTEHGNYHPSGALLVTVRAAAGPSFYAPDGSTYVSVSPYVPGSQRVTIVSGAFA